MRSVLRSALSLLALTSLAGCWQTVRLTPEILQQQGRSTYAATPEKVFKATEEALASLGIGVAVSKPESGLIVSKRQTLLVSATRTAWGVTENEDAIQYDISVRPTAGERVEVIARPRAYRNATELTDQVWTGQSERWQKLFSEIHRMLGTS